MRACSYGAEQRGIASVFAEPVSQRSDDVVLFHWRQVMVGYEVLLVITVVIALCLFLYCAWQVYLQIQTKFAILWGAAAVVFLMALIKLANELF
jgi:hypothetical protein